jgi:hypothetical protein
VFGESPAPLTSDLHANIINRFFASVSLDGLEYIIDLVSNIFA